MNKVILVLLFLLVVSFAFLLLGNLYNYRTPLNLDVYLDYPQFSVIDDLNNVYVIDTSLRRILIADMDGNLLSEISGGDRREGGFYYANSIIPGTDDTFFVLNYVLDENGMFLVREELIEYSLSGTFQRIFYQRLYETRKSTLVQRGEIFNPVVMQDSLYFFLVDETEIRMIRRSLQRGVTEIIATLAFPDAIAYVADIEWINSEQFLILDKRGYMSKGDLYGNLKTIYYQSGDAVVEESQADNLLPENYLSDMNISGDGQVYVTDLINRQIVSIPLLSMNEVAASSDTDIVNYRSALNEETLLSAGEGDETFIYYHVGYAPEGFAASYDFGVYHVVEREISQKHESFRVPASWITTAFIWWLGVILGTITFFVLIIYTYIKILKRRLSLMLKQALVILPLMGGGIAIVASILLQSFIAENEASSTDKLLSLTQTISTSVDGDRFHGVTSLGDYMNEDYRYIRNTLRGALNYNIDSWNEGLYFALYQVIDENLYGFMYLNNAIGLRHPFTWYEDPQSVYRAAYEGSVVFEQAQDISGNFLYAIAPIYDSQNQPVALLEIGSDLYSFQLNAQRLYNRTIIYMSLVGVSVMTFIMIMTFTILRNLGILRKGVERIAEGDWNHTIDLKSNDEVSELGVHFNHMSASVNNYINQIAVLNKSYQKFFPDEFLQHLDLQSVTEVKLGDQVQKEMSILFSDIRAFTSISEKLSPEQNFNFLNGYLNLVGPIIRKNHGFIDKYIGDAIMALFPTTPADAIQSGIKMLTRLKDFNRRERDKGWPEIDIGIGIHTGKLMLGILGEQQRMEGTVIADSVNLAARLETLSKQMGASIITSEETLNQLDVKDHYIKRYMGRIQVVGKNEAVKVYEILNGLPEEELEAKLKNKNILSESIRCFEEGDMQAALSQFVKLQVDIFNNKVAELYLFCIEQYYSIQEDAVRRGQEPPPWDGVLRPTSK